MIHHVVIPYFGATGGDIQIVAWLVEEGAFVKSGTPLFTVETDKASEDIPAFRDGYLRQILAPAGSGLAPGTVVAVMTESADESLELSNVEMPAPDNHAHHAPLQREDKQPVAMAGVPVDGEAHISPRAHKLAEQYGIDLRKVRPSRPDGVIRARDVLAVLQPKPETSASIEIDLPEIFLLRAWRRMVLIRHYEEHLYHLFLQGIVPGTLHQCQGQEAVAVGVCFALRNDDVIFSTHRPVGHLIAKGASINALTAEIWGKATGCVGGKGGQMHLADFSVGAMVSNAIVGANIPIATGAAMAFRLQHSDRVAVSFFGDGASNIGAFHEGLNLAAVQNAPVVFVCENNLYAASTHISETMRITDIAERAKAYGIPGFSVDGMDFAAVHRSAVTAVARARQGGGPTLLEYKTYRYRGHSRGDPCGYRDKEEFQQWNQRDPIELLRSQLAVTYNVDNDALAEIEAECQADVERAVTFALESPEPAASECDAHVFIQKQVGR